MATTRDASLQADIAKMKTQPDGSFKRAPSSFRKFIEKGGQFEPVKGVCPSDFYDKL
jgi:glutathionyl-hydroquinone reductase